jgi:hypothetical protein
VREKIAALIDRRGRFESLTLYDMNFSAAARRAAFIDRVARVFEAW